MDFWNITVLTLTFLAPLVAIVYFSMREKGVVDTDLRLCITMFGLVILAAAIGSSRIEQPVKLEFLWPLTMEPSGYFEFSLQLLWTRFVWIAFTGSMFLGFTFFDGPSAFQSGKRRYRFPLLVGAFLSAALAFLAENVILSLFFAEITAFLLHAFGLDMGGAEAEMERVSYFKRACFIFLALMALLVLAFTGLFSTNSLMLMGTVLYLISLVFSRHNFSDWRYLPLTLIQFGLALFLLERVLHEEVSAELWLPFSAVFALASIVFWVISLLSPAAIGGAFWLVLGLLSYLLFLRFSSNKPADPFWGSYEAIGLACAYCAGIFYRFGQSIDLLWKRVLSFCLLAILLGIVSGTLPGIEAATMKLDGESSLTKVLSLGALTFLLSVVAGKGLAFAFRSVGKKKMDGRNFAAYFAPAVLVFAAEVGAHLHFIERGGDNPLAGGIPAFIYDARVLLCGSSIGFGVLAGIVIGTNTRFLAAVENRNPRMEEFFPSIDPIVVRWNEQIIESPEAALDWMGKRVEKFGKRGAGLLEQVDRRVFSEKLHMGVSEYGSALSLLVRFFHSGSVRLYLFLGVLITLFSAGLFLLEGR